MTARWTLNELQWDRIEPAKVDEELLQTIKTAALVEANSADYVTYLHNVFEADEEFKRAATEWGVGFQSALEHFRQGYRIPVDAESSVRGSHAGELVARCVVESGTSSFYSAIRDKTKEQVLKTICGHIARDEVRHYKLFKDHLGRYLQNGKLGLMQRTRIAFGRVGETGDDELAYAYYSANVALNTEADPVYDRRACARAYWRRAMQLYDFKHVRNAAHMILKATGLDPNGRVARLGIRLTWTLVQWRVQRLQRAGAV
jgi:rubrerythrin